jgi:hypothetical protein
MAEFVRAQIFGTTFEITSRWGFDALGTSITTLADKHVGIPTYNPWGWVPSVSSGNYTLSF